MFPKYEVRNKHYVDSVQFGFKLHIEYKVYVEHIIHNVCRNGSKCAKFTH